MIELTTTDPLLRRLSEELSPPACAPIDLSRYTSEDIEAARYAWAVRIVDEYRSVVVFSELLTLLAKSEAPFACLAAVQRLIGDELRHARRCAEALDAVSDGRPASIDLSDLGLPPTSESPLAWAYQIVVREIVVAEHESVVVLRAYRDATTEPALRAVLQDLLRDEVRHAAVGPRLAQELAATMDPDELADVRRRVTPLAREDARLLREAYRSSALGGPGRALGASIGAEDLDAPLSAAGRSASRPEW